MEQCSKVIIYGASSGGKKVAESLLSIGYQVECFVDSNPVLWGREVLGILVYSPDSLLHNRGPIVIASEANQEAILETLVSMNQDKNVILKEKLLYDRIMAWDKNDLPNEKAAVVNDQKQIFFELLEGYQLGGIESWTVQLVQALREEGKPAVIVTRQGAELPSDIKEYFAEIPAGYDSYQETVRRLVLFLTQNLPCTVVLNKQTQLLYAACLVRRLYPGQVKIVSVMHNDLQALYRKSEYLDDKVDSFFAVSSKIKSTMTEQYHIDAGKVFYMASPVPFSSVLNHDDNMNESQPVRLCYAARLTIPQKRSDRLPKLIGELENQKINYIFHIAGDGDYYQTLEREISLRKPENRVILYGRIKHQEMAEFWRTKDIFINLSDFEGSSISLIEAMSEGIVPIVTNVSGSDEFITEGENGYIISADDYADMAVKIIKQLNQDRAELVRKGKNARLRVEDLCNIKKYSNYLFEQVF